MTRTSSTGTSNNPRGFTLVEVLLVLAILSMVAVLAAPRIISMAAPDPLEEATSTLVRMVHTARVQSLAATAPMRLSITASPHTLTITPIQISSDNTTGKKISALLPENVSLSFVQDTKNDTQTRATTQVTITKDGYTFPFKGVVKDRRGNEKKVRFSAFLVKIPGEGSR